MAEPAYSIYLVRCCDGSLYTGIATDVARRLKEHEASSRGAKFLRGKGPLTLVYTREIGDRSAATKVENAIKRLPRHQKQDEATLSARITSVLSDIAAVSKE
ncbi:MAG: GIY-YIG nuclease family protein [Pseudomonadota bacterium]|nr:GIY-YIG nuclease family protein [Pseudomonadota bacterium]MEE3236655.1 GIY-YIG nuclease family protein [Pseudomonadota bacterium]